MPPIYSADDRITPARAVALDVLSQLERSSAGADDLLDRTIATRKTFSPEDRALAQAIVYGVARWRRRLDDAAAVYAKRGLPNDARVQIVLRAATFQILHLDKVPDSAAVDTAVEAAKLLNRHEQSGFINAVLRKVSANAQTHREPPPPAPDAGVLAWAKHESFPDWMAETLEEAVGADALPQLLTASNRIAPVTLRARAETSYPAARWAPDAKVAPPGPVRSLDGFADGKITVQDEAAQLITVLLAPRPGERILDVGAAPGGKTFHAVDLMGGQGEVVALDSSEARLTKLAESARRLQLSVESIVGNITKPVEGLDDQSFDRVLVDAPCSALGIVRRKPDVKWARTAEDLARLAAKQRDMLVGAARTVRPGGVLVYSVCTLSLDETIGVVDAFKASHPEFELVDALEEAPDVDGSFRWRQVFFRSLPSTHGTDGFFAARWRRRTHA